MPKIFIFGIDGGSPELIEKWSNEGKLPNFKKIIANGVFGKLHSTIPPITPCAWSSFMTGVNPGKHGVYDFFYLDDKHRMRIHSSATRKARDLWEYLTDNNIKSFVFNVPFTYPPKKINGLMVTGFTTPSTKVEFTYPTSVKDDILAQFKNYQITPDSRYSQNPASQRTFKEESFRLADMRYDVVEYLLGREQYDFVMAVFNLTDTMQHWYWKYMDRNHYKYEQNDEFQDTILEAYQKMDDLLGKYLSAYPDFNFVVISDHGGGPFYQEVILNHWLKEQGYLFLKKNTSTIKKLIDRFELNKLVSFGLNLGLWKILKKFPLLRNLIQEKLMLTYQDIDWEKTVAYSYGYSGPIYINQAALESPEEYESLRAELIAKVQEIEEPFKGQKLITKIWTKEEIYEGKYLASLPDIILVFGDFTYCCSSTFPFGSRQLFADPKTFTTGTHTQYGVLIAYGDIFKQNYRIEGARLMDMAPTILNMFDVAIPADMDGKVLEDIFREGTFKGAKIDKQKDTGPQVPPRGESYTDEEEQIVKDRLKSLGYL